MKCLEDMYDDNKMGNPLCPLCRVPLENYRLESSRRRFLNCDFVPFNEIMQKDLPKEMKEAMFVYECFKNTSEQCASIQNLGILASPQELSNTSSLLAHLLDVTLGMTISTACLTAQHFAYIPNSTE